MRHARTVYSIYNNTYSLTLTCLLSASVISHLKPPPHNITDTTVGYKIVVFAHRFDHNLQKTHKLKTWDPTVHLIHNMYVDENGV